jgi:hypothetical protein
MKKNIQSDTGEEVSNLGGEGTGLNEKENDNMRMFVVLNGYPCGAV